MKIHQIKDADRLPELPRQLLKKLDKIGLRTGSAVFGGWIKGISDIDYILVKDDDFLEEISEYIINAGGSVNDGASFYAYYAKYEKYYLNLIVVEEKKYFDAWKDAHNLLMGLIKHSPTFKELIKEKEFRVKQFQLLRETFGWKYNIEDNM